MCVFGQKEFSLFQWSKLVDSRFCDSSPFYLYDHFVDWIWDICILGSSPQSLRVAVGTAHNTVVLWDVASSSCVESFYGKERCILYSMAILNLHGELLIASGTVFTEVHIWSPSNPETVVCKGHKGVIFKLRWSEDGRYLLSVSDDRTLIAWQNQCSASPWSECESTSCESLLSHGFFPLFHAIGHTARIWDCLFTPSCLITSSEDCTLRFWSHTGACLTTCGGHKGKHVWCIGYDPATGIAVSGGNDGSVKLWDVESIVNSFNTARTITHSIPTVTPAMLAAPRDSKAEGIREIAVAKEGASVLVASNWGYVWEFQIAEQKWNTLVESPSHDLVLAAGFSNDATIAALGSFTGDLRVYSLSSSFPPLSTHLEGCRMNRIIVEECEGVVWVVVVQADSTIRLLSFSRTQPVLQQRCTVHFPMKGVVTSVLWSAERHALWYGDSLGGVHWVRLAEGEALEVVSHQCLKRHGRIPVCALAVKKDMVWSGGHDGRIVPIRVNWDTWEWESQTAITVPKIKQILSIWWSEQGDVCVAGFHETDYIVTDITNMYEVMTIPVGGWKRPCSGLSHASHPFKGYCLAFGSANGFTSLCVFRRQMDESKRIVPSLCPASHGREINTVHWIAASAEGGLLMTGGEDRRVQVVQVRCEKSQLRYSVLHAFQNHSSSVRGLASFEWNRVFLLMPRLPDNRGYLLFSCGGRNTICAWSLAADASCFLALLTRSASCVLRSQLPIRDASNSIEGGDQRFMDVSVLPCDAHRALVGVGDSRGSVELYAISDTDCVLTRVFSSIVHATPILSLRLCEVEGDVLAVAGTASGDVVVLNCNEEVMGVTKRALVIPEQKKWVFSGIHVMGMNDFRVWIEGSRIVCVSVGDDQTMRVTTLCVKDHTVELVEERTIPDVSGTSIRGIACVGDDVFITGWEQTVQKWNRSGDALQFVGKVSVQVPETGCIDVIRGGESLLGSVCGAMGFEVFDISI